MATKELGIHQSTYDAVFQHPIARNLQWREVHSMLNAFSEKVEEEHNGNFKFTRKGQTLTVHPPRRKDFSDVQELMEIRHFLERAGGPMETKGDEGEQWLVVIDHREARIFKTALHGAVPVRITPVDTNGSHRYLHNVDENGDGQVKPELKPFYEAVAKALKGSEKILIFGSATGSSSAMEHLVAEFKAHHAELAKRVVGTVVVNEQHLTDDQLLAKAREFYSVGAG